MMKPTNTTDTMPSRARRGERTGVDADLGLRAMAAANHRDRLAEETTPVDLPGELPREHHVTARAGAAGLDESAPRARGIWLTRAARRLVIGRDIAPVQVPVLPGLLGVPEAPAAAPGGDVAPAGDGVLLEPLFPRGAIVRTKGSKQGSGYYAPLAQPAPTTSRQAEILNPALIAEPLDEEGIAIGRDRVSQATIAHDPFTAYQKDEIDNGAVVVLGDIGSGKSSLLKTVYCLRPMILRGRRIVVVDRKDQAGAGEYTPLVERYGGTPFRMIIGGGGTRINPVDPRIVDVLGPGGVFRLLRAMGERAQGGIAFDSWEAESLRIAIRYGLASVARERRDPLLSDVVAQLGRVDQIVEFADYSAGAKERMHQAGLTVRQLFRGTLDEDLAGLFDGPTSEHVQLQGKLTSFDVSQLPHDSPAMAMVLAVAHAWLLGTLRSDRGHGTNFLVEEGWDMMSGPIAEQMNANQMLARGLGLSNIAALHHVAQVPPDSKAASLIREPETVHIYRQSRPEDAAACVAMYDLEPGSEAMLQSQPTGVHLLKIGSRREIQTQHVRSAREKRLTDTDGAMTIGV